MTAHKALSPAAGAVVSGSRVDALVSVLKEVTACLGNEVGKGGGGRASGALPSGSAAGTRGRLSSGGFCRLVPGEEAARGPRLCFTATHPAAMVGCTGCILRGAPCEMKCRLPVRKRIKNFRWWQRSSQWSLWPSGPGSLGPCAGPTAVTQPGAARAWELAAPSPAQAGGLGCVSHVRRTLAFGGW